MISKLLEKDRLTALLDAVPACISYIDKDLYYRYVNAACEKIIGQPRENILGKTIAGFLGPAAYEQRKEQIAHVMQGETVRFESQFAGRHFDVTYTPDFSEAGIVEGFIVEANDVTDRVIAQKQLVAKNNELHDYIENANVAMHWVNGEGIILWANRAELDMLGYAEEEYVGHHFSEFHADKDTSSDMMNRLARRETLEQFEACMLHKNGSVRNVLVNSSVFWEDGKFVHTRCFTIDITEKRQARILLERSHDELERMAEARAQELLSTHEKLRRSEERYQRMISEVQDYAVLMLDTDGNILNWNKGAEKIKGYKADEIIGQNFRLFYSPADRQGGLPEMLINEAITNNRAVHEGWRIRKDGTRFWGSVTITTMHDDNGRVIGFSKVTRDLTERKLAEEQLIRRSEQLERSNAELRRSEERYQRMINEVQDYAILLLDKDGYVQNWNKGAEKIKGYKAADVVGKHFSIFYTKEDRDNKKPERLLAEAARCQRASLEGWRLRKDGTAFWSSVVLTALHDEYGQLIGFSKVTRDLTERKHAETRMLQYTTQLEQKNRELEQFAYVASHDLQEPLRKIRTFNEMIVKNDGDKLSERGKDYFNRSVAAADRMSKLIDDLLLYSRTSTETKNFEDVNLNKLVDDILSSLRETIEERQAKIEAGPLPTLRVVPVQFQQLLDNLVTNALKYRHPERVPDIRISSEILPGSAIKEKGAEPGRTYCKISIADNGIGFDQQYAGKIFELFQRLHGRSEYSGSGIGLSICTKIVQNHGGFMSAEGRPGEGATFNVYLPESLVVDQASKKIPGQNGSPQET